MTDNERDHDRDSESGEDSPAARAKFDLAANHGLDVTPGTGAESEPDED